MGAVKNVFENTNQDTHSKLAHSRNSISQNNSMPVID